MIIIPEYIDIMIVTITLSQVNRLYDIHSLNMEQYSNCTVLKLE